MGDFRRQTPLALAVALGVLLATPLQAQAVAPTPPVSPSDTAEAPLLVSGQPLERTLSGGRKDVYRLHLEPGQYARILADQKSIDVVLVVFDPSGRKLRETDQYQDGPEKLSVVSEVSGDFRLEVRPSEDDAAPGRYEIRVDEIRPEAPNDRIRVEAETADDDATRLKGEGTAESLRKSIDRSLEALALWKKVEDPKEEALTLRWLGDVHAELGEHAKAIEYLQAALPVCQRAGDRENESNIHNDLGRFYGRIGQSQRALEHYEKALEIDRALGLRRELAGGLNNVSLVYWRLGQPEKALEALNEALPIAREFNDRRIEANILTNSAMVYIDLGNPQKALELLQPVPGLWKIVGDREGEANALANLGLAYGKSGDDRKALDFYLQALPIVREVGQRYGEAYVLTNIGGAYDGLGEEEKALDALRQALPIRRAVGDLEGEAATLRVMAKAERRMGNLSEARAHSEAALANYEILRSNVLSPGQRSSFFAHIRPAYEFEVDLLMELHTREPSKGWDALALQWAEKSRARSLLEVLAEARADVRQGISAALLEREQSVRQRMRNSVEAEMRVLSGKHTEEEARAARNAVSSATAEIEQVEADIRAQSPRYASLVYPQPLALSDVQRELDPGTVLLEYALGEGRSFVWVVSQTGISSRELPRRTEIEAAARSVYDRFRAAPGSPPDPQSDWSDSVRLSRMVLPPASELSNKKRLLIVADGALQFVPFGALPISDSDGSGATSTLLIADREIVSLPSASTLAALRRGTENRRPAPKAVAVLADPVFEKDDARVKRNTHARRESQAAPPPGGAGEATRDGISLAQSARDLGVGDASEGIPRLPFTRREAKAILALVPETDRKEALDFDASLATATGADLGRYRFVHFATHGFLDSVHPELSGIVLSLVDRNGKEQDGFLPAFEIFNLKLPAELVVLSACRTALGKEIRGEGLVGLTRAFMYAGAPRVVASLWRVDDAATAELMKRFYEGMLGSRTLPPSAALREAQIALREQPRWAHPYYWAAFVLQGDWK